MAADSLAVSQWDEVATHRDPKLFRLPQTGGPDLLLGFTTSYRMGQLLMGMRPPEDPTGDGFRYMVSMFIPETRRAAGPPEGSGRRGSGHAPLQNGRDH